jgi:glycosyltransferase involved in cell wall biosynthesis
MGRYLADRVEKTASHEEHVAEPLVTIVTPSYNQGRFIRQTIESVLSQDYRRVEYMVIDGKSSDGTVDILKDYNGRFFWVSEEDQGQAHAINKGWKLAKGDVFAWLNSDDIYLPGAISKAVDFLIKNPDVGMVYGDAEHIREDGDLIDRYPTEPFSEDRLIETCCICQPATFIRRSVIEEIGFLDESLNFCVDYDLWIRISKKHALGYLRQNLAQSRLHSDCKTKRHRVALYKEALETIHRHYKFVPPSWACGYAYRLLEGRLNCSLLHHKAALFLGLVPLCAWNFWRYNLRMPASEWPRWMRGLWNGGLKLIGLQRKESDRG